MPKFTITYIIDPSKMPKIVIIITLDPIFLQRLDYYCKKRKKPLICGQIVH